MPTSFRKTIALSLFAFATALVAPMSHAAIICHSESDTYTVAIHQDKGKVMAMINRQWADSVRVEILDGAERIWANVSSFVIINDGEKIEITMAKKGYGKKEGKLKKDGQRSSKSVRCDVFEGE